VADPAEVTLPTAATEVQALLPVAETKLPGLEVGTVTGGLTVCVREPELLR
jgi:hypothetical protein